MTDASGTLGLAGDGDDTDLIQELEAAFGLTFGAATRDWFTVGDIYDAVVARRATAEAAGACATSMAFYRVRAALRRVADVCGAVTPQSRLADLTRMSPRTLERRLAAELGGKLSITTLAGPGAIGLIAAMVGVGAVFVAFSEPAALWWVGLAPLGALLVRLDPGRFEAVTVGDVARDFALRNFARLADEGADRRPAAVWRAVQALAADAVGMAPGEVGRETRLMG